MDIEQITFHETKKLICEIIGYQPKEDFHLIPNDIFLIIQESGVTLRNIPIRGWHTFEYGDNELSLEVILSETKLNLTLTSPLIIITDDCFKEKKAYKISSKDLFEFSEDVYYELHGMDLLQPFDLIFIQPETNTICMIHHDGFLFEY